MVAEKMPASVVADPAQITAHPARDSSFRELEAQHPQVQSLSTAQDATDGSEEERDMAEHGEQLSQNRS